MNAKNLFKLQALSQELSILYVDNDISSYKKLGTILEKIFPTVHQAHNGKIGLQKFKKFKPDIVITDLILPKKTGIELIVDIQELNPNTNIIVLSEFNDEMALLQSIDINIKHFLFKPYDIDKLISSFLKIITDDKIQDIDSKCLYNLELIKKEELNVEFINSFKGIPIQSNGKILDIKNNEIVIKVPDSQIITINQNKQTILRLNDNKYIHTHLLFINKREHLVTLINPKYITFHTRDINNKRVVANKRFKATLHYKHKVIDVRAIDMTYTSLSIYINDKNLAFNIGNNIDLTLGFEIDGASSFIKEKKFTKIFATGSISRIDTLNSGKRVIIKLVVKKAGERTFRNYLQQREMETIQEFKRLLKK